MCLPRFPTLRRFGETTGMANWLAILSALLLNLTLWSGADFCSSIYRMAISGLRKASTICFRGYECPIEEVLEVTTKMFRGGTVSQLRINVLK